MIELEDIKRLHMRDGRHVLSEREAREEAEEARTIGWITVFYLCVLIVVILCS